MAQGSEQNESPQWIVKASARILGPYSLNQVIQQLRERRLSLIDELRGPFTRWRFMREMPELQEVIQAIRDEQDSIHDDTQAILDGAKTVKDFDVEELTPTPTWIQRPAVIENKPPPAAAPTRAYGLKNDQRLVKNIQKSSGQLSLVAWTAVAILGVYMTMTYYRQQPPEPAQKTLGYEDYLRLAKYNKSIGSYEKALDFFRKAESVRPLENSSLMQMAPLLMIVENNQIEARRLLETSAKNMNPDPKLSGEIQILVALTYMGESRMDEAKKILSSLAETAHPSIHVHLNSLIMLILQGANGVAFDQATQLIKNGAKEPTLVLIKAIAAANSFTRENDLDRANAMVGELSTYLEKHKEFLVEGLLVKAALQVLNDDPLQLAGTLQALFDELPELSRSHVHDLMVDQQIFKWSFLFEICEKIVSTKPDLVLFQTLKAYCHWQKEDYPQAIAILEKNYKQDSKGLALNTIYAYVLKRSERSDEAKAILKIAPDSKLASLLTAEWCVEDANWNCAAQSWNAVLAKDPMNIVAIHGLARRAQEIGQKSKAQELVSQGLLVSPNYGPLLELKEQLDAE